MRAITHGSTDQSIELYIAHDSASGTPGDPATGLAYNSSGIDLWYRRAGGAKTSITEATQTVNGAHSDGGFVEIGNGVYRLDPPDAAFASGASHVTFGGTITGYVVYPVTVQLTAFDLQTATQSVNVAQWLGTTAQGGDGYPSVNVEFFRWVVAAISEEPAPTTAEIQAYLDANSEKLASLPTNVTPGSNGGLPTVDANNRVAGIAGTITTLDALDTAQDAQHAATKGVADSILEDTGTTLPSTLSGIATDAQTAADTSEIIEPLVSTMSGRVLNIETDTNELQGLFTTGGTLRTLYPASTIAAASDVPTDAENAAAVLAASLSTGTVQQALEYTRAAFQAAGVFSPEALAEAPTGGGGSSDPVAADVIDDSRTWFATDYKARNIVTVGDNFAGSFALQPDLNPGTTIATVDSVSITGAATVTATDLSVNRSKTRAHFTVPALTTTGTYTVVVTVTTVDGQTIPTTATLRVQ